MNVQRANKKGFTIIEVVLVLAIAALIFLMIFVALPALQRGQRNTARKEDVGTVASAVNTYRSNRAGALPADGTAVQAYIDKLSQVDKSNVSADDDLSDFSVADGTDVDKIQISRTSKCDDDGKINKSGSPKQAAVQTVLEEGGGWQLYCQTV